MSEHSLRCLVELMHLIPDEHEEKAHYYLTELRSRIQFLERECADLKARLVEGEPVDGRFNDGSGQLGRERPIKQFLTIDKPETEGE